MQDRKRNPLLWRKRVEHNILTWNLPNWLTVILMVALGYLLVALIAQGFKRVSAGGLSNVVKFPSGQSVSG